LTGAAYTHADNLMKSFCVSFTFLLSFCYKVLSHFERVWYLQRACMSRLKNTDPGQNTQSPSYEIEEPPTAERNQRLSPVAKKSGLSQART